MPLSSHTRLSAKGLDTSESSVWVVSDPRRFSRFRFRCLRSDLFSLPTDSTRPREEGQRGCAKRWVSGAFPTASNKDYRGKCARRTRNREKISDSDSGCPAPFRSEFLIDSGLGRGTIGKAETRHASSLSRRNAPRLAPICRPSPNGIFPRDGCASSYRPRASGLLSARRVILERRRRRAASGRPCPRSARWCRCSPL